MADYFSEMGWRELGEGETPDHMLHLARLLRDNLMFNDLRMLNLTASLPPPCSKTTIENLESEVISSADKQCPVCLKEFDLGETVKKLPCKHIFHSACILPWLEKTSSCPVCRYDLPTDDEVYEEEKKERKRAKERVNDIENLHNSMFS